ncbi:MAG: hypothetical protein JWM99_1348 [Verrucomicrobiales bacterium]|nr:hypothetical protein [Verrucomicrobiales bacterium]
MAADPSPFLPRKPTLRHLILSTAPLRLDSATPQSGSRPFRNVERQEHAKTLGAEIKAIEGELQAIQQQRIQAGLPENVDLILELDSSPGFPFSADHIHALGSKEHGIALLHARPVPTEDGKEYTRVLLYVPFGKLNLLAEKIRRLVRTVRRQEKYQTSGLQIFSGLRARRWRRSGPTRPRCLPIIKRTGGNSGCAATPRKILLNLTDKFS